MQIDWTTGIWVTTYGTGPFHPAFHNGRELWYWPDITFETEDDANEWAQRSMADALKGPTSTIAGWNVCLVPKG